VREAEDRVVLIGQHVAAAEEGAPGVPVEVAEGHRLDEGAPRVGAPRGVGLAPLGHHDKCESGVELQRQTSSVRVPKNPEIEHVIPNAFADLFDNWRCQHQKDSASGNLGFPCAE
jgi:hypothetical protein